MNYFTFVCNFEFEKFGKEAKKIQKCEYLENKKRFLGKIKSILRIFEGLSFGEKINSGLKF